MEKFLLSIVMLIAGLMFPVNAVMGQQAAPQRQSAEEPPSFYAVTSAPTCGISVFKAEAPLTLSEVFSDNDYGYFSERIVSAYGDGHLFFFQPRINNSGELWKLRFVTYNLDGEQWSYGDNTELECSYENYPHFMTYDPQTKTLYGVRNGMPAYLYTIDQQTGAMTTAAQLDTYYNMMATDAFGVTYATDYNGYLYKVDLTTGRGTLIGNTKLMPNDAMIGYVDPVTQKLYLNFSNNGKYTLYEIDTKTAQATKVDDYPDGTVVRGLIPAAGTSQGGEVQIPDVCQDLSVSFTTPGGKDALLRAVAPALAFDKETPLEGNVVLNFYVDDAEEPAVQADNVPAGAEVEAPYTFADYGMHIVRVAAENAKGTGAVRTISVFVGFDTPAAPSDINLSIDDEGKYSLTWAAPEKGVNGGDINTADMKYVVTMYPAGTELATVSETSYSGTVTGTSFADYYFGVKAVAGDLTGEEGLSNHVTYGYCVDVPYYDDFSDEATHGLYTIVNPAGDATWIFGRSNLSQGKAAIYDGMQCASAASDYFILPPMELVEGATYTVTFKAAGGFNQNYGNHLKVLLMRNGTNPETATLTELGSLTNMDDYTGGVPERSFSFVADESTVGCFAFYCSSEANRKVYLYDVSVTAAGYPDAPEEVTDLIVMEGRNGEHKATISFTAPSKDVHGDPLTEIRHISIFREDVKLAIGTLHGVQPGEQCEYVDEDVSAGTHTYRVVVFTDGGSSDGVSRSVLIGEDIPAAPKGLTVTEEENDFLLEWTAPSTSMNGGYVDYANLTYNIYFSYGLMEYPETYVTGVKGCQYRVPKSVFDDYASGHQILISFIVQGQSEGGSGDITYADIIYGKLYELPFSESFADGYLETEPWGVVSVSDAYTQSWSMIAGTNSSKPMNVDPQDGDNGMAMFYHDWNSGYEARLLTPQMTIEGKENPVLTFYVYHYPLTNADGNTIQVEVRHKDSDNFLTVGEAFSVSGERGWQEHKVSLKDIGENVFRLAFRGKADNKTPLFLDNVKIADDPTTGITSLGADGQSIRTQHNAIVLNADGADFRIYSASGVEVASGRVAGSKTVQLAPGMYIVSLNGKVTKCAVK